MDADHPKHMYARQEQVMYLGQKRRNSHTTSDDWNDILRILLAGKAASRPFQRDLKEEFILGEGIW